MGTAVEITSETLPNLTIRYDMETCRRCGGEGRLWQHSNVDGGTCFRCSGRKRTHTTAASKAWQVFRDAQEELMTTPVEDVMAGDAVRDLHHKWRRVESVSRDAFTPTIWQGNPDEAWKLRTSHYDVTTVDSGAIHVTPPDQITVSYVSTPRQRAIGMGSLTYTVGARVMRFDREAQVHAVRRIAGMPGVTVTTKS